MPSRSRIFGCMSRTGIWSSTAFQPTLSAWHRWSRPLRGLLQFARTIPWSDDYTRRSDFRSASRCSRVLAREIEGPAARKICPSVLGTCRPDPTMNRKADPSWGRNPLGGQRFGSVASESVLAVIWTRCLIAYARLSVRSQGSEYLRRYSCQQSENALGAILELPRVRTPEGRVGADGFDQSFRRVALTASGTQWNPQIADRPVPESESALPDPQVPVQFYDCGPEPATGPPCVPDVRDRHAIAAILSLLDPIGWEALPAGDTLDVRRS